MILKNKKIILAVSGSIAAYKSAFLVRLLVKEGAEVKVILTDAAKEFITPLTLGTLSKNPVISSFTSTDDGTWHNHVELGLWADIMIIAPATAHTLAKCAHGICDSMLVATYLSARCPVYFAPAMDLDMYAHFSTEDSLEKLKSNGNFIIEPNSGELASGLDGKGRMAEPEEIVDALKAYFVKDIFFTNKKVLITAGPSQEDIDPVRFISNHSSGKMGYAIAKVLSDAGADVKIVSGPVSIEKPIGPKIYAVRSAEEMFKQMQNLHKEVDIVIFAAAVADYKPKEKANQKIKKKESEMFIELTKTIDIAAELGKVKKPMQVHVGFALETNDEYAHAIGKLERKNFDMIILNSLQDKGAGFRHDTNKIAIMDILGNKKDYELKHKDEVATDIKDAIKNYIISKNEN
jgi:phosphopantothenoylcysteine decarboxylase / phosphopantothenate---cysteine ligase